MPELLQRADELSRRNFVLNIARTCLGVSVLGRLAPRGFAVPFEGASKARQVATARNVIYLYMGGGMSHLDTFGVVPGAATMGPTKTIDTSADGVQISENLPLTAGFMHQGVIVNSLYSTQGAHSEGQYYMRTSYTNRGAIRHPTMGAWLTRLQGKGNPTLPGSVLIGTGSAHPGAGFFDASIAPLIVDNPAAGLQDSRRLASLTDGDLQYRIDLASKLDAAFQESYSRNEVKAYADVYREAVNVMNSADLAAFNLAREPEPVRKKYGADTFGQGCLLARRLVEHGVRFVEVAYGGWDMHNDTFVRLPEKCRALDRALSSLLGDLEGRGLLDETLVVLTTEFGRTPEINANNGRDHYPKAFTSVLWGGGVAGGQAYGKTDKGIEITENQVSVPDFNATIAYALGLPLDEVIFSPTARPFTVCDKGQPITSIFA